MTEALGVTSTNITSFNHVTNRMKVVAEYWGEEASPAEVHSDLGTEYAYEDYATIMHGMMKGDEVIIHESDEGLTVAEREQFALYQIKSMMFLPILARGHLLGTIEVWESRHPRYFSQADIRLALAMASHAASVIENAQLYERLEHHDSFIRAIFENSAEGVAVLDADGKFSYISPSEEKILGYDPLRVVHQDYLEVAHPSDVSIARSALQTSLRTPDELILVEYRARHQDGSWRHLEVSFKNLLGDPNVAGVVVNFRDITERKQAAMALEQREAYFRALIENSAEGVAIMDAQGILIYLAPAEEYLSGYTPEDLMGTSAFDKMHPDDAIYLHNLLEESLSIPGKVVSFEYRALHKNGEWQYFEATGNNLLNDPNVRGIVINYRNITPRKQAEQALKESQDRLFSIITTAPNGIIVIDSFSRIVLMNPAAERIFVCSAGKMMGKDLSVLMPERYRVQHHDYVKSFGEYGVSNRRLGRYDTLYGQRLNGEEFPMEAFISKYEMNEEKFYTVTLQDITERKQDEDNLKRRAEELQKLAIISSGLRIAMSVREIIPLVVRHAVDIVAGHYGTIYMLEESTGNLVSPGWYSVEKGEDINVTGEPLLRHASGKGITGHVAKTGEVYITEDLQRDPLAYILPDEAEILQNAHGGISLPLLSREKVIGVLHVRLTTTHSFDQTEIRLLTAIAEMAGNALHRANLYEQTLRQTEELARAYDSTLSGWARALEMRDELTEGHTRRVTELTLELARAMNISESELIQIRRGAILHDIGKMGIPDSILNKPGPLAAHEQRIMRMHPQYAHEMLSFIPFLQPAVDIPYCHHEWWDGNGYPRGLRGEEIPLSARIFSVVDVWDALTSDRPYRPAWTTERTLKYIKDGSGKQFDPHVVDAFLSMLEKR
jgi:PAS domain S-box-containing protein